LGIGWRASAVLCMLQTTLGCSRTASTPHNDVETVHRTGYASWVPNVVRLAPAGAHDVQWLIVKPLAVCACNKCSPNAFPLRARHQFVTEAIIKKTPLLSKAQAHSRADPHPWRRGHTRCFEQPGRAQRGCKALRNEAIGWAVHGACGDGFSPVERVRQQHARGACADMALGIAPHNYRTQLHAGSSS
ncbi:hypothetical protein K438DRAFT_1877776, partial [Mycena galopus ATCC 62051]